MAVIQHRRDTKENWLKYDPVLAAGEIAIETDTYRAKVGDGQKKWSELPYITDGFEDNPEEYLNKLSITNITYEQDLVKEITFENGAKELFTYDTNNILQKAEFTKDDGETIFYKIEYEYDEGGNLIKITRSYV